MDWNLDVSNDLVGLVLLGMTVLFGLLSGVMAARGFRSAKDAAKEVQDTSRQLKGAVATAQGPLAEASGDDAAKLAQANENLAQGAASLDDAVGGFYDALGELKGAFAPARAFLALTMFAFLAALVVFEVITFSVGSGDNGAPTTTAEDSN